MEDVVPCQAVWAPVLKEEVPKAVVAQEWVDPKEGARCQDSLK